ncbi:hypothetical protein [Trichocoleus sp. FACHB-591]|nr:hypothetical protein [Trichocoleus sp. FACHB-591]
MLLYAQGGESDRNSTYRVCGNSGYVAALLLTYVTRKVFLA